MRINLASKMLHLKDLAMGIGDPNDPVIFLRRYRSSSRPAPANELTGRGHTVAPRGVGLPWHPSEGQPYGGHDNAEVFIEVIFPASDCKITASRGSPTRACEGCFQAAQGLGGKTRDEPSQISERLRDASGWQVVSPASLFWCTLMPVFSAHQGETFMLVKINNLIINTDHISLAKYAPGPPDRPRSVLIVHFRENELATSKDFKGEEADKLWELLCAEARDALAP